MTTLQYFIAGAYYGESQCEKPASSLAFFCPTCGEIWARVVSGAPDWELQEVPCGSHAPSNVATWGSIPGSILHLLCTKKLIRYPDWGSAWEYLPPAVKLRELHVHIAHFERSYNDRTT